MSKQDPHALTPKQIAWIQQHGLTIHTTLVPKMNFLSIAGEEPDVDSSEVQLFTRIESGGQIKVMGSEFVRNTRGQLKRLIQEQIKNATKELLDHRFPDSSKPITDDSAE